MFVGWWMVNCLAIRPQGRLIVQSAFRHARMAEMSGQASGDPRSKKAP